MQEDIFIECEFAQQERLKESLNSMGLCSSIPDLYWLPVPDELLSDLQEEHKESCGPYVMALEITASGLNLEMLVRAKNQMHCACIAMAAQATAQHMLDYVHLLLFKDKV